MGGSRGDRDGKQMGLCCGFEMKVGKEKKKEKNTGRVWPTMGRWTRKENSEG